MTKNVTEITPYGRGDKSAQIGEMFDHIAPAYDVMNNLMSFGLHRIWLRQALHAYHEAIQKTDPAAPLLDVATGTGDIALHLCDRHPLRHIIGIDLSEGMLRQARDKAARHSKKNPPEFLQADCLDLPFPDNTFAGITVAYGVRNFADLDRGYAEMYRVLRPGGVLSVLELSEPHTPLMHTLYRVYTTTLIPLAGRIISHDTKAYTYLPQSIHACPARQQMTEIMTHIGFEKAHWKSLFPGTATMYIAYKPITSNP